MVLARSCPHLATSHALEALGVEWMEKAAEIEREATYGYYNSASGGADGAGRHHANAFSPTPTGRAQWPARFSFNRRAACVNAIRKDIFKRPRHAPALAVS